MNKARKIIIICLVMAMSTAAAQLALAYDAKYKYTIPTMQTQEDADKIIAFIKTLPGIMEVDAYLDKHTVIVFFDDEELDDEKMQFRIPMKKEVGYPVTKYDILYEDPNKRN